MKTPNKLSSQAPSQQTTNESTHSGQVIDGAKYVNGNKPGSMNMNPSMDMKDSDIDSNSPYAIENK